MKAACNLAIFFSEYSVWRNTVSGKTGSEFVQAAVSKTDYEAVDHKLIIAETSLTKQLFNLMTTVSGSFSRKIKLRKLLRSLLTYTLRR